MSPGLGAPEDRWRRTVEQRGRPLKLRADRLFNEFGLALLQPGAGEEIESRLADAGLQVRPPLDDVTADQVLTLEITEPAAHDDAGSAPPAATSAPPEAKPGRPQRDPQRAEQTALSAELGLDDMEQSTLVRAALEAERRVRNAYDRAAAAAAERVAALERELTSERAATARARDERDELERRLHGERRAAASRQQALAAAERTARGLLEAQRAQLSNLTQTLRVSTAAIAQTRETLGDVHGQVQQTATDVREALTESALGDDEIDAMVFEPAPPAEPAEPADAEPAAEQRPEIELQFDAEPEPDSADEPAVDEPADEQHPGEPVSPAMDAAGGPAAPPALQSKPPSKRGLGFARRRRRVSLACAVCGRSGEGREPRQLADAGWHVEGEVALCLTCVADDWTLAEGETVPVRSAD